MRALLLSLLALPAVLGGAAARADVFLKESKALGAAGVTLYVVEPKAGMLAVRAGVLKREKRPLRALDTAGGLRAVVPDASGKEHTVGWGCGAGEKGGAKAQGLVADDGAAVTAQLVAAGEGLDGKIAWKPFKVSGDAPACATYKPGFDRTSARAYRLEHKGAQWFVADFARDPGAKAEGKCPETTATVVGTAGAKPDECVQVGVSAFDCDHQKLDKKGLPRIDTPLGVLTITAKARTKGGADVVETWLIMGVSSHESNGLSALLVDDVAKPVVKKAVTLMVGGC